MIHNHIRNHNPSKNSQQPIQQLIQQPYVKRTRAMSIQDKSGQMSMDEFNWAYATLQQEVEDSSGWFLEAQGGCPPVALRKDGISHSHFGIIDICLSESVLIGIIQVDKPT